MKGLLSVPEVAQRFEVTNQTVRNWIASGRLSAIQPTRRGRYRIPSAALRAFEQDAASRRPDEELARVVDAIVASVRPDAVVLFGSRARGDFTPDSDFDLALIAPDGAERRRVAMQAYESIAAVGGRSVGVDLVVLTPQVILAERELPGSIARAVVRDGVLVYGSATVA